MPCFSFSLQVSGINSSMSRKREQRVLFMVVIMVICYLLCWLPYGIMALLATFGPPGLVTPEASIIPSVLAKTSTIVNPVIYVFMNKQVRLRERGRSVARVSAFCLMLSWSSRQSSRTLRPVILIVCKVVWYNGNNSVFHVPIRWYSSPLLTLNNLNLCGWRSWFFTFDST